MKYLILLSLLNELVFSAPVAATLDDSRSNDELVQEFRSRSVPVADHRPWSRKVGKATQTEITEPLQKIADRLCARVGSNSEVLQLLNELKDHDGASRQALCRAIQNARAYSAADLPFLRSAFVTSLSFATAEYPPRLRGWLTPPHFREELAGQILRVSGQGDLISTPDHSLLESDPAAWLRKHLP